MYANKNIQSSVQSACESLVKIQDLLLNGAGTAAKSDEPTAWQDAEMLFQLAKEVDGYRRRLAVLLQESRSGLAAEPLTCPAPNQRRTHAAAQTESPPLKKKKNEYPKYLISDNCLVKIGLQRDRRTEYQHIVQKAAFDKIASVITNHLTKAKEFTPESIQADLNLPAYQTYVVLAMFRQMGLLKSLRRGLYTASSAHNFVSVASDVWNKLSPSLGRKE